MRPDDTDRLLNAGDDGPDAAGVAVLTHRFWSASLKRDPTAIGKSVRLGSRNATVVGVLEPSGPYPADTGIIANVVTSPHQLGATMVTERTHRMTELFGRLEPGATAEAARTELTAVHAAMMREHPEAYSASADVQLRVTSLRDQITAPARAVLLVGESGVLRRMRPPPLPSWLRRTRRSLGEGGRITPDTNRRLRVFAVIQIAFSFVLLAGAGTLRASLVAMQTANTEAREASST